MDAVLTTPRLVLRPFQTTDAPAFHAIMAEPDVARMTASFPSNYDLLSAQGFIDIARARSVLGHAHDWAVTENGDVIGSMGLFRSGNHWEIGYALGSAVWGRGIATEIVIMNVAAFIQAYPNTTLHACVFTDNPGSRRVLLKTGFIQTDHVTTGYSLCRRGRHDLWNFTLTPEANITQSSRQSVTSLAASTETA